MSQDDAVRTLGERAGFSVDWTDQSGDPQTVSPETLRRLLTAMGLDCESDAQTRQSLDKLEQADRAPRPLVTARVGEAFAIDAPPGAAALLTREDGEVFDFRLGASSDGRGEVRPILEPGYHTLAFGETTVTVAVAPPRGLSIVDAGRGRPMWGLAAQVYGLTRAGDGGIGDLGGVAALARSVGAAGADALALSPLHAGFSADPHHFGPYSPSSRLFLNPLCADPDCLFGEARVTEAARVSRSADDRSRHERETLIDWPGAGPAKLRTLRALYDSLRAVELAEGAPSRLADDFARFRRAGGDLLEEHARFEAIHAARFGADHGQWDWRGWPKGLRDPASREVAAFADANFNEVGFHVFLQWVADRSFAAAQSAATSAGMAIGLISDLAVGMAAGGSHAWSRRGDLLAGLSVGSPPDLFNPNGQSWGLATFSPAALKSGGFAPYLATLRACMKNAGGVRIDHVMGLARLWVAPEGEDAKHGAYLAFPLDDMLRLTALESVRNNAVVVGEDLGTVPEGLREKLAEAGVAGMRVLQFERSDERGFFPPSDYSPDALAMTTTHDLPTMAGWWTGADIALRGSIAGDQFGETSENDVRSRDAERGELWRAFEAADVAHEPQPAADEPGLAVDAAVRFLAETPSRLVLLPLEDALGQVEQPNLPGTLDEHPNWRRRLARPAPELIAEPAAAARLASLNRRRTA